MALRLGAGVNDAQGGAFRAQHYATVPFTCAVVGAKDERTCLSMLWGCAPFRVHAAPGALVPSQWHQEMVEQHSCGRWCSRRQHPQRRVCISTLWGLSTAWQVQTPFRRCVAGVQGGQEPHHAGDGCGGTGPWYGTGAHRSHAVTDVGLAQSLLMVALAHAACMRTPVTA